MEPAAQKAGRKRAPSPVALAGELVFQNGKKAGTRRRLGEVLTCIGQASYCEIRLQGISPLHCLLLHRPDGLELRDLGSPSGTLVNGKLVNRTQLHDGDHLQVGEFQFRVHLPPSVPAKAESPLETADALRIQAAAVAAQQAALMQEEDRLHKRVQALEQQAEQLSSHLEEKRQKLVELTEAAQTERAGLNSDRLAYEQYVKQVTTDSTEAQRDLVAKQQQLQAERRRLSTLHQRLKQRWQRVEIAQKNKYLLRKEELANEEANLARENDRLTRERAALQHDRLEINGQYELGRRQLLNAWSRIRRAQQKWRQRRSQERAALCVRSRDLENAELELVRTQRSLEKDKTEWHNHRLETEALDTRIKNQRDKICAQQQEIDRLDAILRQKREAVAAAAEKGPGTPVVEEKQRVEAPAVANPCPPTPADDALLQSRLADLDRLAGELADQRQQLAEQWERLVRTQHSWQADRDQAAAELETLGRQLQEQEKVLTQREQQYQSVREEFRCRHQELVQLRQHLAAWQSRLQTRESSWEGERGRLLDEIRRREKLVQEHLANLEEIRRRWGKNRREEVAKLQAERKAGEDLRQEYALLRLEWQRRCAALEDEKRSLAEKSLALEQLHQETIMHSDNSPAAEHRIERLRRNWLTQNAAAIRALADVREGLETELTRLESRCSELQKRGDDLITVETAFAEKHTAWEHSQALLTARHSQMQRELEIAQAQRQGADQQLAKMREEMEHIARVLLDDPAPPALLTDQAA